jgi:ketosteroid isomerase-like protein
MIRPIRAILAIPTLVFVAACAKQVTPPAVDLAAEAQGVRDASAQWMKAVQAKDWAAAAAYFAPDGMAFPEHQQPLVGPAAIQAADEADAAMMTGTISWATDKVTVSTAGDMALEIGTWTFASDSAPDTGRYVTVWQKVDGQWKALADIGVSTEPEAAKK